MPLFSSLPARALSTLQRHAAVIIPARMASKRFPGKPLALIGGKPLIQRTLERVKRAQHVDDVFVATDDARIAELIERIGSKYIMTSKDCESGTERVKEASQRLSKEYDIIVNVQGDEPLIDPAHVDQLILHMLRNSEDLVSTLACPIRKVQDYKSPNVVKVVFGLQNQAMYFSRSPIPFSPTGFGELNEETGAGKASDQHRPFKHLGIYAFRRKFLSSWSQLPTSALQTLEDLEQLKILASGHAIRVERHRIFSTSQLLQVLTVPSSAPDVNVPEDVRAVEKFLLANAGDL